MFKPQADFDAHRRALISLIESPDRDLRRRDLGQFLTPRPVADLMASLFEVSQRNANLLDAGAGTGELSAAVVRKLCASSNKPERIAVTAYELDHTLVEHLQANYTALKEDCNRAGIGFSFTIVFDDFVEAAVRIILSAPNSPRPDPFNVAIVNPPYRKIRSDSPVRVMLRAAKIETGNLYTAFLALICKLLADHGEMVAITPRSFCNGTMPFR